MTVYICKESEDPQLEHKMLMSKANQEGLVSAPRLIEDSEHTQLKEEVMHHEARGHNHVPDENNKTWRILKY